MLVRRGSIATTDEEGAMSTKGVLTVERLPRFLLHLEGMAVAAAALVIYFWAGHPWWLILVLALAPDFALAASAAGPRIGATAYDVAHTYALPVSLGAVGVVADSDAAVAVALIWVTHIGVDRAIGYGLKYPSGFKDTHLQRV
jgi:Domain of unknown function (DUF4260)